MLNRTIKRFYKDATTAAVEGGFAVQLDGRGVKTPATKALVLPTQPLAEAVAAEWRAQGEQVQPHSMPLTQLASTALDRVGPEREAIIGQLMGYAATDLLCYRVDSPADLVLRQTATWQPLLDWASLELDAPLKITATLLAVEQPADALAALRRRLDSYDVWRLTVVQAATAATGSLVLALALGEGRLTGAEVFQASQLDETYQIEQWGEDYEAADRRAALQRDIEAAERLSALTLFR
jgi:chaperone required for assembly of F1-ATPase